MRSVRARWFGALIAVAIALGGSPSISVAAEDLPLDGHAEVLASGSSVAIDLQYLATGPIAHFRVEMTGPAGSRVLFESSDLGREVAWSGVETGLQPGLYTVTASAEVLVPGQREQGTRTWAVEVGGAPQPAAPPPGSVAVTGTAQAVAPYEPLPPDDLDVDVLVYGGTPSGVMAAISAARPGTSVALVEPSGHVGGMISNGLTATDYGHTALIGGLTKRFFDRTEAAEGSLYGRYRFQPSTAELAFVEMLRDAGVTVIPYERLRPKSSVSMDGTRIASIRTSTGRTIRAAAFVDASYEGDLMAAAGVSYRIGREAASQHQESYAGVRAPITVFTVPSGVNPAVPLAAPGSPGSGDSRIQNSNYRLCFSSDPKNRVPFSKPEGYDPALFDLPAAYIASRVSQGHTPDLTWFLWPVALPNQKFDVNNNGLVSIGIMGLNYPYPDASYATRESIAASLREYTTGFLYFLANDARVPGAIRSQMAGYGLCADEFTDNGNFPRMLYLREGRRMSGRYLLTQRDVLVTRTKSDSIAVGSYAFDSHHVSRWMDGARRLKVEGGFWSGRVNATRFSIPYRALTPQQNEASNLLVSVTTSATHVATSALRLEPQYMMMGEAAGLAAQLIAAGPTGTTAQSLNVPQLQQLLRLQGAVVDNYIFWDTVDSPFRSDIELTFLRGITFGCTAIYYCPTSPTTREVMAGFLANALNLPPAPRDYFSDDEASPHEDAINRVAAAGVTAGCGDGKFCPTTGVSRGQMAAFLGRAFRLPWTSRDYFTDDEKNMFEGDINRLASSGITAGCGGTRFCPDLSVSRGQMAAFIWRAVR